MGHKIIGLGDLGFASNPTPKSAGQIKVSTSSNLKPFLGGKPMTNIRIIAIQSINKFFNPQILNLIGPRRLFIASLLWLLGAVPAVSIYSGQVHATEVSRIGAEWDLFPGLSILESCDLPSIGITCVTNTSNFTMQIEAFAGTLTVKPSAGPSEVLWIIMILDKFGVPRGELYGAEYVDPQTLAVSVRIDQGGGVSVLPGETVGVFLQISSHTTCVRCVEAQMAFYWYPSPGKRQRK